MGIGVALGRFEDVFSIMAIVNLICCVRCSCNIRYFHVGLVNYYWVMCITKTYLNCSSAYLKM